MILIADDLECNSTAHGTDGRLEWVWMPPQTFTNTDKIIWKSLASGTVAGTAL